MTPLWLLGMAAVLVLVVLYDYVLAAGLVVAMTGLAASQRLWESSRVLGVLALAAGLLGAAVVFEVLG